MSTERRISRPKQISVEDVVTAALDVLDEVGLEKLTMRRVALRLDVQLNTVYWHVKSKPELMNLMADELLAECVRQPPEGAWHDRVKEVAGEYRHALLSRRDGGRLSIARFSASPHLLRLSAALHQAFLDGGLSPASSSRASWHLSYLALASAIEEQEDERDWGESFVSASPDVARGGPLADALMHSLADDHQDRFEFAIDVLLRGVTSID